MKGFPHMHIFKIICNFYGSYLWLIMLENYFLWKYLFSVNPSEYFLWGLKVERMPVFCIFRLFCFKFVAWCTCPCILSFLPLASVPRTLSTHSTCTLGSAWEIWNGYSNCSAWMDWDIDETADCPYSGSINSSFWGFLRSCIHLQDPPLCSYIYVCFCVHAFYFCNCDLHALCTLCASCVGGEPAESTPSESDKKHSLVTSAYL